MSKNIIHLELSSEELSALSLAFNYFDEAVLSHDEWNEDMLKALHSVQEKVLDTQVDQIPKVCRRCMFLTQCPGRNNCTVYQMSLKVNNNEQG